MTRFKCSDKQPEGRNRAGGGKEWREGEKRGMVDDNEAKTVRYLTAGMRLDGMYSTVQW